MISAEVVICSMVAALVGFFLGVVSDGASSITKYLQFRDQLEFDREKLYHELTSKQP